MLDQRVQTPCIGVCSTGIGDSVCRGCKRFCHEVIDWNSYNGEQKRAVDQRLSGFLSRCMRNRFHVEDSALLAWQLRVQQIRYTAHHDEYCWLFSLLKAGAGQIGNTRDYGFTVLPPYRNVPLAQLRNAADEAFYILSEAYYARYMQTHDLFAGGGA